VATKRQENRQQTGDSEPKTADGPEDGTTTRSADDHKKTQQPEWKGGKWPKGYCPNPGGRPKGPKTLTSTLRQLLREPDPQDPTLTRGDRLIQIAYVHAAKGNFQFFKEIFERNDGKVPDRVEAVLSDGWEMEYGDAEPEDGQDEQEQEDGDA
jgi:hypothetical protein